MCATGRVERPKSPGRVAAGMETQRKLRRKKIKPPQFNDLIVEGIAPDGSKAMTRPAKKLGIYMPLGERFGILRVHFRIEGRGPKVVNTMDAYRAVRQSKHIPKRYMEELEKNDALLWKIGKENLQLAAEMCEGEKIEKALEKLEAVLKSLKGLKVPKKKFSKKQLADAIKLLREALGEDLTDTRKIIWACTKLVSFRTRYGDWRDREIVHTSAYSDLRSYALRKIRDELLVGYISDWVRYLEKENRGFQMRGLWIRDLEYSDKLEKLIEKNRKVNPEHMEDMMKEFYDAEYNIRKLNRAYEQLVWGNQRMGRRLIREYMLALRVRNPLYAAREMEKETDEYYQKAKKYLISAADLINKKVFARVVQCFRVAASEIKFRPQTSLHFPSQSR